MTDYTHLAWLAFRELLFVLYIVAWIVARVRLIPDRPRRRPSFFDRR